MTHPLRRAARALVCAVAAGVLLAPDPASAQGGVTSPDLDDPCPAVYPGDSASLERIARWMARGAIDRGLPRELPVMAGLAESGLRNLSGADFDGYFGITRASTPGSTAASRAARRYSSPGSSIRR